MEQYIQTIGKLTFAHVTSKAVINNPPAHYQDLQKADQLAISNVPLILIIQSDTLFWMENKMPLGNSGGLGEGKKKKSNQAH